MEKGREEASSQVEKGRGEARAQAGREREEVSSQAGQGREEVRAQGREEAIQAAALARGVPALCKPACGGAASAGQQMARPPSSASTGDYLRGRNVRRTESAPKGTSIRFHEARAEPGVISNNPGTGRAADKTHGGGEASGGGGEGSGGGEASGGGGDASGGGDSSGGGGEGSGGGGDASGGGDSSGGGGEGSGGGGDASITIGGAGAGVGASLQCHTKASGHRHSIHNQSMAKAAEPAAGCQGQNTGCAHEGEGAIAGGSNTGLGGGKAPTSGAGAGAGTGASRSPGAIPSLYWSAGMGW